MSTVYCTGAAFVLRKPRALRWATLISSLLVGLCTLTEIVLLDALGAKAAYYHLGIGFTVIHAVSLCLGPPAIGNLALLLLSVGSDTWSFPKIGLASLVCWVACMVAAFGNILVGEAIVGVDAGTPFFMSTPHDNAIERTGP